MRLTAGAFGKRVAVLIVLSLGGGCEPVAWQRAETAPIDTQNDLEGCWSDGEAAVRGEVRPFQQEPAFGPIPAPSGAKGPTVLVVPLFPGPAGSVAELMQHRYQLVDRCMRARGYAPGNG